MSEQDSKDHMLSFTAVSNGGRNFFRDKSSRDQTLIFKMNIVRLNIQKIIFCHP